VDNGANQKIKAKYDNIASAYDTVDWFIPDKWRRKTTRLAYGRVLEVGIGTGLNLPFYPDCCREIFGVDISPRMLGQADKRAALCQVPVKLEVMDVQDLLLNSDSFDCILATFVFCTVPDPFKGLRECRRVLKPGGKLILLEHMGSENELVHQLMDWLSPIVVTIMGDHINRNTVDIVAATGFRIQMVENLLGDVVRLIVAER